MWPVGSTLTRWPPPARVVAPQTAPIAKPASKGKWAAKCRVRAGHLNALCRWYQAQQQQREAEAQTHGFGLEIAMLRAALDACTSTARLQGSGLAITVRPTPDDLQRSIRQRLEVRGWARAASCAHQRTCSHPC